MNVLKETQAAIEAGADVNAKSGYDGGTPLIYAARNGNIEILNILIQAGADIGAKDDEGKTALDYAKESDNYDNLKESETYKALENADKKFNKIQ